MDIVSPYGKDVTAELKSVYMVASVEELVGRVRRFLAERYAFKAVHLEQLHVAFGIAVRFVYKGERYYLKFTGRANHRQPEALFGYFEYLRGHRLPLPEVVRTLDGAPFENILEASPYDVTYVMKALPGGVMVRKTPRRLEGYVDVMAAFHRLGAEYRPRVYTGSRDVHAYFREARESLEGIEGLIPEQQGLLKRSLGYTHEVLDMLKGGHALSKTHVHGDFRFCHIFFEGGGVSGIIDAEHAGYAERVFDVCTGLVSHTHPARCLLLEPDEILGCLRRYERRYAFSEADRRTLKGMMLCALLNELAGVLLFTGTGRSEARETDIERVWRTLHHFEKLPEGLGLAG